MPLSAAQVALLWVSLANLFVALRRLRRQRCPAMNPFVFAFKTVFSVEGMCTLLWEYLKNYWFFVRGIYRWLIWPDLDYARRAYRIWRSMRCQGERPLGEEIATIARSAQAEPALLRGYRDVAAAEGETEAGQPAGTFLKVIRDGELTWERVR